MKGQPEERAIQLAQYMVETGATVRQTAAKFGVSKSTVHMEDTKGNVLRDNRKNRNRLALKFSYVKKFLEIHEFCVA